MSEVYGLIPNKCSKCKIDYVPGNMYFIPNGMIVCFGGNINENIKCMKCPECGESRPMTNEEILKYKDWYKRIKP